jgi:hypothetical protein
VISLDTQLAQRRQPMKVPVGNVGQIIAVEIQAL